MGINKYKDHLYVLPEDDANVQIANGFILHPNLNHCAIQVLPCVGGWTKVLKEFEDEHISEMKRYPKGRIVLLIDFDERGDRLSHIPPASE